MGICNSSNEGRIIRLTKKTIYQFNDNEKNPKKNQNPVTSKSFKDFKIKEIKCGNFYNINNNYNYSISNTNNKEQNDEPITGLKLINQPMINLQKEINNDIYEKLISYFNSKINQFPYNSLSESQISILEKEYTGNKIISPYKFIENKNYGKIFNKIYELCFLKCEPLLNNINDNDKKGVNFLFYRTIIILLRETPLDKTIEDLIILFIELSYDNNSKYINKENFYNKIKSFCEICYQILFYFFVASNQFTDEQYYEYLCNDNILIDDKYSNVDIDLYCLNFIFNTEKGNLKLEEIIIQWTEFINNNINYDEINSDNMDINDKFSNLKNIVKEMVNPYKLFEVLAGLKLPNS